MRNEISEFYNEYSERLFQYVLRNSKDIKERWDSFNCGQFKREEYSQKSYEFYSYLRSNGLMYIFNKFVYGRRINEEDIRKYAEKETNKLLDNFFKKVHSKVGETIAASNLTLASDNQGGLILNGTIKGVDGIATVKSVLAGGYNIQRLHIRVLVK